MSLRIQVQYVEKKFPHWGFKLNWVSFSCSLNLLLHGVKRSITLRFHWKDWWKRVNSLGFLWSCPWADLRKFWLWSSCSRVLVTCSVRESLRIVWKMFSGAFCLLAKLWKKDLVLYLTSSFPFNVGVCVLSVYFLFHAFFFPILLQGERKRDDILNNSHPTDLKHGDAIPVRMPFCSYFLSDILMRSDFMIQYSFR